ncbi:hypothetical protein K490DRAFT_11615, partial [Saccharata proteae CBS 121410]
MALETLTTAPDSASFTPLAEHQSQTPGSFFGGKPVLHLHSPNATLVVSQAALQDQTVFPDLRATTSTSGTATNGDSESDTQLEIPGIDVWVTSSRLMLFSPAKGTGVSIPYPAISLHAIQRLSLPSAAPNAPQEQALYMQLTLSDDEYANEEDVETLEISVVPTTTTTSEDETPIKALFGAVSACADLNPDPQSDDEDEDEDPATMPGAGGWITAENMNDFMDEEGNFIGGGALGDGAGHVRTREDEMEDGDAVDGAE